MNKSDIVIAIVVLRSKPPLTVKQIRKDLNSVLIHFALDPDAWDQDVDEVIAKGVIKHIGSVKGELTLQDLVVDIDMILKRIS